MGSAKPFVDQRVIKLRRALWSRRRPIWETASAKLSSTPETPVVSLRTGRASWSPRQPALAIVSFEPLSTPPIPAVSLRTGKAAWSPRQPPSAVTPLESPSTPSTAAVSLRTGKAAWSPRQPASDNTSVESPASPATPPVSLRTGRARWSPRQALPDSFWAEGSLWSHRKPGECLKAPPSSRTSNCDTDCKTGDRRFSSQTALYEYIASTIEFDWAGEAEKLNREARRLELLHALEPLFQEQEQRSSAQA
ncbi:hypothetical protein FRC00_012655 [Tulasnella sp. 408]|nr:hypothetical protein FRC00_012655 [Tulasnella sp. 408]